MEEKKVPKSVWKRIFNSGKLLEIEGSILLAVIIAFTAAILFLGFAKEPVFFTGGKIVQLVDTRTPIEVVKEVAVETKKDPEKEIQKITYCIQSIQPRHSYDSALLIAKATYNECTEKGISIPLWIALMFAESSLDPMKTSATGAVGLCQIKYDIWKNQPELNDAMRGIEPGRDKLFWVDINIKCGTAIFKKYYEESSYQVGLAVWRYNSGQLKLPDNKKIYELDFVGKVMYYTLKVTEILAAEETKMQIVVDVEMQSEPMSVPAVIVPTKKPITRQ